MISLPVPSCLAEISVCNMLGSGFPAHIVVVSFETKTPHNSAASSVAFASTTGA